MMVVAPLLLDHKVSAFFSGEFTNAGAAASLPTSCTSLKAAGNRSYRTDWLCTLARQTVQSVAVQWRLIPFSCSVVTPLIWLNMWDFFIKYHFANKSAELMTRSWSYLYPQCYLPWWPDCCNNNNARHVIFVICYTTNFFDSDIVFG